MAVAADRDSGFRPVQPDTPHQTAQLRPHLLATRGLAGAQDGEHAMASLGVVDVDRHEAAFIVMRIEQRQLLMAVNRVGGIVDIQRDCPGGPFAAVAPQVDHRPRQADQRAQIRCVLPTRHCRLRGELLAALRQAFAGQLERWVVAQVVQIVGVGVATGDGEDTGPQNIREGVRDVRRVAVIAMSGTRSRPSSRVGDDPCQGIDQAKSAVGTGQQQDAAVRADAPAIEAAVTFFLLILGRESGSRILSYRRFDHRGQGHRPALG